MDWINGIKRGCDGNLKLEVLTETGNIELRDAKDLPARLRLGECTHRIDRLDLSSFRRTDANGFLGETCPIAGSPEGDCRQSVYMTDVDGVELWMPVQLLMQACFGALAPLREQLFRPGSLELLAERYGPNCSKSVMYQEGARATVAWLSSEPSLVASWASAYRHALDGRLDIDLPNVDATFSTWGRRIGNQFFASQVRLGTVHTADEKTPLVFAKNVGQRKAAAASRASWR